MARPDAVEIERHLFTIACTRPWARLALARQAATEEGKPLEPSPFWAEVVRVLGEHAPGLRTPAWARGRLLSARRGPFRPRAAARPRPEPSRRCRLGHGGRFSHGLGAEAGARGGRRPARLRRARRGAPGRPRRDRAVLGHRAREVRRLLVDVVRGACARPAPDRLRARRPHARLDRPRDACALLRGASRRGRRRAPDRRRPARPPTPSCAAASRMRSPARRCPTRWRARSSPARSSATSTPSCAARPSSRCRSCRAATRCGSGARWRRRG